MSSGSPIAELPDEVTFTLDDVALLLFIADTAVERTISADRTTPHHVTAVA